ncbi:hypothetical protein BACCAP_01871 [Pseudoflavonifractor capillosus ATCC 29799]|uniref:Uncharacterized protein n=1 Tax=Pseudoflavonifractor capillosus ATCC 29799 TaxID=411467 RepID=A6NUI9_9FIRM|nr:hypothetical protein BACCAP_01871 [Pseudoflavonifractor capillosus ATCC 29799]
MHCALERRIRRYGSTGRDPERGGGPYAAAEEVKKADHTVKSEDKKRSNSADKRRFGRNLFT